EFSKQAYWTALDPPGPPPPLPPVVPIAAPSFPDCTDQVDRNGVDLPVGINKLICRIGRIKEGDVTGSGSFAGHSNWFPIHVEGHAGSLDHSIDDDYTFTFRFPGASCRPPSGDNRLSVNGRGCLHSEFDSDETIDGFRTRIWSDLHRSVDAWEQAKGRLAQC